MSAKTSTLFPTHLAVEPGPETPGGQLEADLGHQIEGSGKSVPSGEAVLIRKPWGFSRVSMMATLLPLTLAAGMLTEPAAARESTRTLGGAIGWSREVVAQKVGFEPNVGQTSAEVRYVARGRSYGVFLTDRELVMGFAQRLERDDAEDLTVPTWLRLKVLGSEGSASLVTEGDYPGVSNYLIGNDPRSWKMGVRQSESVRYHNIKPGVDLVVKLAPGRLLLSLELAPGIDPSSVDLQLTGLEALSRPGIRRDGTGRINALREDYEGGIDVKGGSQSVHLSPPVLSQIRDGKVITVNGAFTADADGKVHLNPGSYEASLSMQVETVVAFSSTLGGSAEDAATAITQDSSGNLYLAGQSFSSNFPTSSGAYDTTYNGATADAVVTKLDASGTRRIYSTYLGGNLGGSSGYVGWDTATGIAVDTAGSAFVIGRTYSSNFPTTPGSVQTRFGGGNTDIFVTRLDSSGSRLLYSTYLGGADSDSGEGIAVGADGSAYITGYTYSKNYPVTSKSLQTANKGWADAVVTRVAPSGNALVFSTYLGGSAGESGTYGDFGKAISVGSDGSAFVAGHTLSVDFPVTDSAYQRYRKGSYDAFLTRLTSTGDQLLYSTYLGGTGMEVVSGLATDKVSNAWVLSTTTSGDAPVASGAYQKTHAGGTYDLLINRLDTAKVGASSLVYGTYMGGSAADYAKGIQVDRNNTAYVVGGTQSLNFPVSDDAAQARFKGGEYDGFFARVSASGGTLLHGTFVGGNSYDYGMGLTLTRDGEAWMVGVTSSTDLTGAAAGSVSGTSRDIFVSRFQLPSVN